MTNTYEKPAIEVLGSLEDLTLVTKIIGGNLDGVFLKIGKQKFALGLS